MSLTLILGIFAIYGGIKLREIGNEETKIIGWILMIIGGIVALYHIFPIIVEILRITLGVEVSEQILKLINIEKMLNQF